MTDLQPNCVLQELRDPESIRARCANLLEAGLGGQLEHFTVELSCLESVARRVEAVTHRVYPDGKVPRHSRLNHFTVGGVDRVGALLAQLPAGHRARARVLADLVVVSVLLDAGAGPQWGYTQQPEAVIYRRSEGLAVASYDAFVAGVFSSKPGQPLCADANGLRALEPERLGAAMQVSPSNPLPGLDGRCQLLRRLGERIGQAPEYFGGRDHVGGLVDAIVGDANPGVVSARRLLPFVLEALGPIWPTRNKYQGLELGDVWQHPCAGGQGVSSGWLPLHKLSQWLCYSLLDVLEGASVHLRDEASLTGLAEYRNGGLFLDAKVLRLKDPKLAQKRHAPESSLVVEWRGLTVALLERLLERLKSRSAQSGIDWTMGKMLEGGTWQAGRDIAAELRGGQPPLQIVSDGTLF